VLLFGLILLLWILFELFFYYLFFVIWTFYFGYGEYELGLLDQGVHKLFKGVHNFYLRVFTILFKERTSI
jgi:hypothetical protein